MLPQSQPQTKTPLFRTSLRDWQANWKARQASQPAAAAATPAEGAPRVKKFIAYKRRKQKQAAMATQS